MATSTITITDYADENSSFGVSAAALTSGNIVAQTAAAVALEAATEDLTIGHVARQIINQVVLDDPGVAGNTYAHREMKWLVTYQAVTSGKKFQLEIAAPDLTDNLVPNTDIADISSDDWDAWITSFVAYAKSPDDITDSVIVLGAQLVGRNL